ncbi:TetR/AcrR family transcriptional regulator [Pseudoalteromonas sp. B193]
MTKELTNSQSTTPPSELELGAKARTVLQAARKIFLTHGFNGATTDMIQREAGVSKSTVYAHFTNKETLFLAVIKVNAKYLRLQFIILLLNLVT